MIVCSSDISGTGDRNHLASQPHADFFFERQLAKGFEPGRSSEAPPSPQDTDEQARLQHRYSGSSPVPRVWRGRLSAAKSRGGAAAISGSVLTRRPQGFRKFHRLRSLAPILWVRVRHCALSSDDRLAREVTCIVPICEVALTEAKNESRVPLGLCRPPVKHKSCRSNITQAASRLRHPKGC